jgi:hypothetical protein
VRESAVDNLLNVARTPRPSTDEQPAYSLVRNFRVAANSADLLRSAHLVQTPQLLYAQPPIA